MNEKEKKYLDEKISLIEAVVLGTIWGAYMFPPEGKDWGDIARHQKEKAMDLIRKDVVQIYKYGKKMGKTK